MKCLMQRGRHRDDGLSEHAEPPCQKPPAYAVTMDFGDRLGPINYGLCAEHTAWTRAAYRDAVVRVSSLP